MLQISISIGEYACSMNTGNIGYKSCDGLKVCAGNYGNVGYMVMNPDNADELPEGSCIDEIKVGNAVEDPDAYLGVCQFNGGNIEDKSCSGTEACYDNTEVIGVNSCKSERACSGNSKYHCFLSKFSKNIFSLTFIIGFSTAGTIGSGACGAPSACTYNQGTKIGDGSCTTSHSCFNNTGAIDAGVRT